MSTIHRPPASPCVKTCELDTRQVCTGCGRTLDEIAAWTSADDAGKQRIVDASRRRLALRRIQSAQEQQQ